MEEQKLYSQNSIDYKNKFSISEEEGSNLDNKLSLRISELVATFSSRSAAAEVAGVSAEQLRRYMLGAAPRLDSIARMCEASGWSIDYIWSGRPAFDDSDEPGRLNTEAFAAIPRYDFGAITKDSDSTAGKEEVVVHYALRRDWLARRGWKAENLAAITFHGDALKGIIADGQLVLIDLADHDIGAEGLFIFRLAGRLSCKIVQMDWQGDFLLSTNNSLYREIVVPRGEVDQLDIIGRAIWTERLL